VSGNGRVYFLPAAICGHCGHWMMNESLTGTRQHLGNVLAVIHGDGGHHTADVGMAQSVEDAIKTWGDRYVERDALRDALRDMKDLAEFWINRQERRGMSNYEYRTWHQLGYGSNAMQRARAILGRAGGE
jgi:hypothetical protein